MIAFLKFLGKTLACVFGAFITFAIATLWTDTRHEFVMSALFLLSVTQWHLILFGRK